MTVTNITTSGTRQLAVLATVAAMISMAALLLGSALAGLTTENSGIVIVSMAAIFLGFTLGTGWVPGLYLSILMVLIGSIFVGDELRLPRAVVLALTIIVVHETSRFSLDTRQPTRLGAGLLLRTSLGGGLALAVVAIGAFTIDAITGQGTGLVWVPIAIGAAAVPLYAARIVEVLTARVGVSPLLSGFAGAAITVLVVAAVATGAQHREGVTDGLGGDSSTASAAVTGEPVPDSLSTDAVSGSLATLIGMFVAAGILGLLYGAYHRQQLLLEQDDIVLDLDDSRFALSLPDGAEMEDVGLDVEATTALLDDLAVDLDAEPDPGRAIRYAYARVEQQMTTLGVDRGESETAHEFMARALPILGEGGSLGALTNLFERARFSDLAVPESMRDDARDVLSSLRQQIASAPRPDPESEPTPPPNRGGKRS